MGDDALLNFKEFVAYTLSNYEWPQSEKFFLIFPIPEHIWDHEWFGSVLWVDI